MCTSDFDDRRFLLEVVGINLAASRKEVDTHTTCRDRERGGLVAVLLGGAGR